jgi:nucleoside-diphosphate-sugar epimerase
MVLGNGLMASAFINDYGKNNDFVIFASGVSNSLETNINEFKREENLLIKTLSENKDKRFVYFSTFADSNIEKIKYVEHKLNMETLIKESENYCSIFRLPQIIGRGGNKHALANFIIDKLKNHEEITVYKNTYKSLIDVEDVKRIVDVLLMRWKSENTYVKIPFVEKLQVHEIIGLIAKQLNIEAKMRFVDSNVNDFPELSPIIETLFSQLNIIPNGYTERTIKKYIK